MVLCDPLSVDYRVSGLSRHAGQVQEDQSAIRFIGLLSAEVRDDDKFRRFIQRAVFNPERAR